MDSETWVDPFGRTPVWSSAGFRRVAGQLPLHEVLNLVAIRAGRPVLSAPLLRSPEPGGLRFYDVPAMIGDERAFGDHDRLAADLADRFRALDLEAARTKAYPSVALGTYGAHHGVVVDPALGPDERIEVCRGLPGAVADAAAELGCASHGLLYLTDEFLDRLRPALSPQHQIAVLGAESVLECEGTGWEDYVASLSSRRRGRVLKERRDYLAGPDRSHIATGPDAIGSDLVDLRCNLRTRYGLPAERERTVLEFEALARWCGPELVVIRSLRQDEPVGFVICLRRDETLYARTAGFDYDRLGPKDFCYFNVVYYDALEWGLPRGVRRFELGLAGYPAKRTRGCHFERRHGVFRLPDDESLRSALALQDRGERARLTHECGI
ncbi:MULTISPECIES: GNAT family N-acetyltransferase [unclassified Amycolatopsis]|uniref:GNAT family N-acetyltransferase n=1 Tax=unclassified Amycolatopsis TaxID=2618356 RepID=UPI002E1084AF|nr:MULTISPECIES: GNAT family N-acetyltransferase [unclassified Amycolatopsis]WSJ81131.1 GNAT family N-acetyltransferase [Amycolatopsis sp. NBC_01307]WSK75449.1 GNAT family N-acetyltransferase [Amycolatopsis sp. NBC_01286]